jgi:hypothetical protein
MRVCITTDDEVSSYGPTTYHQPITPWGLFLLTETFQHAHNTMGLKNVKHHFCRLYTDTTHSFWYNESH